MSVERIRNREGVESRESHGPEWIGASVFSFVARPVLLGFLALGSLAVVVRHKAIVGFVRVDLAGSFPWFAHGDDKRVIGNK
jgi:hypothetical protein